MSANSKILASSWTNGVFVIEDKGLRHEFPGHAVRGLSDDLMGGAFAVIDGHSLFQRTATGDWSRIATSQYELAVTFAVNGRVYVGTDDARVLVLDDDHNLKQIDRFDSIAGRDSWFAGTAMVNGEEIGPPLGVRSLSGTCDGSIFASVHIGGIPHSPDGGATWQATIDINLDAHEVRVSPADSKLVCAATASGLCISRDGGMSWLVDTEGLHAPYCSAVAFTNDSIFVAASESHFSQEGAVYRRSATSDSNGFEKVAGGLPDWLNGIVDTACIASEHTDIAMISASGEVYLSTDAGYNWKKKDHLLAGVSSVLIIE